MTLHEERMNGWWRDVFLVHGRHRYLQHRVNECRVNHVGMGLQKKVECFWRESITWLWSIACEPTGCGCFRRLWSHWIRCALTLVWSSLQQHRIGFNDRLILTDQSKNVKTCEWQMVNGCMGLLNREMRSWTASDVSNRSVVGVFRLLCCCGPCDLVECCCAWLLPLPPLLPCWSSNAWTWSGCCWWIAEVEGDGCSIQPVLLMNLLLLSVANCCANFCCCCCSRFCRINCSSNKRLSSNGTACCCCCCV